MTGRLSATATTDFLAPDILNGCRRAVPALWGARQRTLTTIAEGVFASAGRITSTTLPASCRTAARTARDHHHHAITTSGTVAFSMLRTMFPVGNEPPVTASSSSSRRVSMSRSMSDACRGSVVLIAALLDGPAPYRRDAYRRRGSHGPQLCLSSRLKAVTRTTDDDNNGMVTEVTVAARALGQRGRTSVGDPPA